MTGDISFCYCDFDNPLHRNKLVGLLNHYMTDPMGGCEPLNKEKEMDLISGLASNPSSFVLFILLNNDIAGLATCFVNFSTFKARPYINIHDLIILKEHRGKGLGRKLLEKLTEIAIERNCCKITLEVRDDNTNAIKLYQKLEFKDTTPVMHFWTKTL